MNKSNRAKLAKQTVNIDIPQLLKSNPHAQTGIGKAELIRFSHISTKRPEIKSSANITTYPTAESSTTTSKTPTESLKLKKAAPTIKVIQADTLTAAHEITKTAPPNSRIAILNMCSPLSPGGGFLNGALAQEESLCLRSTLYPSLTSKHEFYSLPSDSAIYSPSVLIFRSPSLSPLTKAEYWYTNTISAAALRQPDLTLTSINSASGTVQKWVYDDAQREEMTMKVRLLFEIARGKGITHLVLGAWGCGAYGNPPEEVARIFRKVIYGDKRRVGVEGVEEVVFAIFDEGENLRVFKREFEGVGVGIGE